MRQFFGSLLLLVTAILSGCATPPQPPVALSQGYFSTSQGKVGVVMSDLPKADTNFPGAGCLLCLATASALNSKLTLAVKTWSNQELAT